MKPVVKIYLKAIASKRDNANRNLLEFESSEYIRESCDIVV